MYDEDDLLPISALQHLAFCERQCALIHIEGAWADNVLTAEGRRLHEQTHAPHTTTRAGVRVARSLRLHSLRLGLAGQADVVEFQPSDDASCQLPGVPGHWRPFPIEYKRGKEKADSCDEVQLCAQALCLEEMLDVEIPEGALFYGKTRRRTPVAFTPELRAETEGLARRLHELIAAEETPRGQYEKKCKSCSLLDLCMPKEGGRRGAQAYLEALLTEADEGEMQ